MENIIEAITANPVYLAIAVVLAIVVVYGFIKKIIKLVLVTASIFILIDGLSNIQFRVRYIILID